MKIDEYEKRCNEIQEENNKLLALFENDLIKSGLAPKTIKRHISNAEFYINTYLLYASSLTMEHGPNQIYEYFGYFFIRKCLWSTPGTMRTTATSIKKFYKCMFEHGKISEESYEDLCIDIKFNMKYWIAECEAFNNTDYTI